MSQAVKKLEALRKRFDERSQSQPGFSITFGPGQQYNIHYATDRISYATGQGAEGSYREFKALCRQCIPLLQTLGVPDLESGDLLYWARDQVAHERHTVPWSAVYGQGEGTVEILSALDHPYRMVATALTLFLTTVGADKTASEDADFWTPKSEVNLRRVMANMGKQANTPPKDQDSTGNGPMQPGSAKLSPRELAQKHGVNGGALRKRLDRWRYNHDAGYVEVSNPAKNEPKYLYDEAAVMPVIKALTEKPVGQERAADGQQKKI